MAIPAEFTRHCREVLAELDALCARYGVRLALSGTDRLQIWRVRVEDTGGFDIKAIEDHTGEERTA